MRQVRRVSCPLGWFASNIYAIKVYVSSVSSTENGEQRKKDEEMTQNKCDKEGRFFYAGHICQINLSSVICAEKGEQG